MSAQKMAGGVLVILPSSKGHCSHLGSDGPEPWIFTPLENAPIPKMFWNCSTKIKVSLLFSKASWPLLSIKACEMWSRESHESHCVLCRVTMCGIEGVEFADLLLMPYINQLKNPNTQIHPEMLNSVKSGVWMRISGEGFAQQYLVVHSTVLWRC